MKKQILSILALSVVLVFSSCSTRLVDFTVISSKNHSIAFNKTEGKQVVGKSMGFLGLGTSIKDAMDNALEKAGPEYDILIDGVVRIDDYFMVAGYRVTGTAVKSKDIKQAMGETNFDEWCQNNNVYLLNN